MQATSLLDAALEGVLAPVARLAWQGLLQVQQQHLGFQLRCLLEQPLRGSLRLRHQHAVPDVGKGIGAATPVAAPPLLLLLGLELTPIDLLELRTEIPTESAAIGCLWPLAQLATDRSLIRNV